MKAKITLILFACFAMVSCTKWHYGHGHGHDDDDDINYNDIRVEEGGPDDQGPKLIPSPDQLIVRLDPGMSAERLNELLDLLEIKETTACNCGDTNIRRWTVDTNLIDIEGAVGKLKNEKESKGDVEGDLGFDIELTRIAGFNTLDQQSNSEALLGSITGSSVNIAILDTGVDFARDLQASSIDQYMYNANVFSSCYPALGGWNFINNSPNITDGHGHGTFVNKIIRDILIEESVDHRILPLKVFDDGGRGSYWNIVCAMGYIRDINQNGGNITLVNASFGGPDAQELLQSNTILRSIVDDIKDQTMVVASAGNQGLDTDDPTTGHFISSYPSDNLFAVGGYDDSGAQIVLDNRSNFGATSIDVALAFGGYTVILDTFDPFNKDRIALEGTSYGAATMTALAGEIFIDAGMPSIEDLKNGIFTLAVSRPGLGGNIVDNNAIIGE